ncbi:AP2-like ethylene-responsive transcription factor PLT2, partial [Cucurbita argyrosperma subsp. sororia]
MGSINSNNCLSCPLPPTNPSSSLPEVPFQAPNEWNLISSEGGGEAPKVADFLGVSKAENETHLMGFNEIHADYLFPITPFNVDSTTTNSNKLQSIAVSPGIDGREDMKHICGIIVVGGKGSQGRVVKSIWEGTIMKTELLGLMILLHKNLWLLINLWLPLEGRVVSFQGVHQCTVVLQGTTSMEDGRPGLDEWLETKIFIWELSSILDSNSVPIGGGAAKRLKEAQAMEASRKREEMMIALGASSSSSSSNSSNHRLLQSPNFTQPLLSLQNHHEISPYTHMIRRRFTTLLIPTMIPTMLTTLIRFTAAAAAETVVVGTLEMR